MDLPKNDLETEAIGCSRGGLSTKIHATVDAWGLPILRGVTPAQASKMGQAPSRMMDFEADEVIADQGDDRHPRIEWREHSGAAVVIPPRRHRQEPQDDDREIDQVRDRVERLFQQLKPFHRMATGDERWNRNDWSMRYLASAMIWLVNG